MKLTSKVFSALKNIGGSFVPIEDGILSTAPPNGTFDDCDGSELAEDAALRVDNEELSQEIYDGVDSIPMLRLNSADITPVQVAICTAGYSTIKDDQGDSATQKSSLSVCSQHSADIAPSSFSTCLLYTSPSPRD